MITQRTLRYRQIVEHFEKIARGNGENFPQVADLSRIAGINQRTLSRTFREVRQTTPCRYLQYPRLSEVKRVLALEGGSVTQAAMRVGRFGVLYKRAFGEMHAVLHRNAPQSARDTKGTAP